MKTYSLVEVAEMVLPPEWTDGARWLARRLIRGEIRGYRVGRVWRMTQDHVDELVNRFSNDVREKPREVEPSAVTVIDGLSARSRNRIGRTA